MAENAELESATEPEESPKPPKNKLLMIFLAFNTILLVGVLLFLLKRPATASPPPAPKEHEQESASTEPGAGPNQPGPIIKLDSFIIQLKAVEADRYVRVAFDLEVANEADKTIVSARMSQIRDKVITFFSDRTLDELRGSEGMERTKADLAKQLDVVVTGHRIKAIYITDLVVQ